MNKIYIASKASHRPRWREYREHGVTFTSRWIDVDDQYIGRDLPPEYDTARLWTECVEDVRAADVLVLYWAKGERLKGALVEVGVAFSLNMPVFLCGDPLSIEEGSWFGHPLCRDLSKLSIDFVMGYALGYDPQLDRFGGL